MLCNTISQFATSVALVVGLLGDAALAQNQSQSSYTVYSSFIFSRSGERVPTLMRDSVNGTSIKITAYGANQMYRMGQYFRQRYIGRTANNRIMGLNPDVIDDLQITVMSPDQDFTTKSALAFMQSFYPPYSLGNSTTNVIDPSSIMVNETYLSFPSNGFQIPMIQTYDIYSPGSVWINGNQGCMSGDLARTQYYNSAQYLAMKQTSQFAYKEISPLFTGTAYDTSQWSLGLAWGVYELLDYLNRHNTTVNRAFASGGRYAGLLPVFSQLTNGKLWSMYGNKSVSGSYPGDAVLTVAGQSLASIILQQLQSNIYNRGAYNKFNIAVGDFQPMIGLISLLGLGDTVTNFQSLPPFGSSLVFEVYSAAANAPAVPNPDELYVRFLFRNATDVNSGDPNAAAPEIQSYPMFSPSRTDMTWREFEKAMGNIAIANIPDWCTICQAQTLFCIPFMRSRSSSTNSRKGGLSPAVGGVIGGIITLAIAGIIFGALIFFGGMRFYRKEKKSSLGGYKGSAKLASDADLSIPNNAAPPAGIVVDSSRKGHERVGSWELKGAEKGQDAGHQRFASLGSTIVDRPSYEADPQDIDLHSTPTRPRESV